MKIARAKKLARSFPIVVTKGDESGKTRNCGSLNAVDNNRLLAFAYTNMTARMCWLGWPDRIPANVRSCLKEIADYLGPDTPLNGKILNNKYSIGEQND